MSDGDRAAQAELRLRLAVKCWLAPFGGKTSVEEGRRRLAELYGAGVRLVEAECGWHVEVKGWPPHAFGMRHVDPVSALRMAVSALGVAIEDAGGDVTPYQALFDDLRSLSR